MPKGMDGYYDKGAEIPKGKTEMQIEMTDFFFLFVINARFWKWMYLSLMIYEYIVKLYFKAR